MTSELDILLNNSIDEDESQKGIYIARSGNTGAGKSTLVIKLKDRIHNIIPKVVAINERDMHHPLLKLMFSKPKEYSLLIQMNFLIQRHAIIYRLLQTGYSIIIERSHFDDLIFVQNHFNMGHIDEEAYKSYCDMFKIFNKNLPDPDLYIFLDVNVRESLMRLEYSERIKERPKEFPNEEVKMQYVNNWDVLYLDLYEKLRKKIEEDDSNDSILMKFDANKNPDIIIEDIFPIIQEMIRK